MDLSKGTIAEPEESGRSGAVVGTSTGTSSAAAAATAATTSNNNIDAVEESAPTAANGADSAGSVQQRSSGEDVSAAQATAGTSAAAAGRKSRKKAKQPYKCNIKGCRLGAIQTQMEACCASELDGEQKCSRMIHYQCWLNIVVKNSKGKISHTDLVGEMDGKGFCTQKCYHSYLKDGAGGMMWSNDGKNGKNDPNCSENLLVKLCLSDQKLWEHYKDPCPMTKNDVCQEFADTINAHGVRIHRTAHQVRGKIDAIEAQMKQAIDFADTETGMGLELTDPDEWEHAIQLKCRFYHTLYPVWIDRAGMKPLQTTEDMLNYNSDDSSEAEFSVRDEEMSSSDDDDSDEDASSSQQKKKEKEVTDLCSTSDDDDEEEEEEEGKDKSSAATSSVQKKKKAGKQRIQEKEATYLTMSDDDEEEKEGSSAATSAQKKKSVKQQQQKKKSRKGKTKTKKERKTKTKRNTPTTDDLLRKLVEMKTEAMEAKGKKRKEREELEEAKRKRAKFEDYDLNDFEQYLELSDKFKKLCDCVGGDKVQVCMQFPKFAETNLLTDEEKHEFHERQQRQNML